MDANSYSYRQDPAVPAFDDSGPVLVVDGYCALCTGGIAWLLRFDRKRIFKLATIQFPTGRALYTHYGMNVDAYDTFMIISNGKAFMRTDGYIEGCRLLGGVWRIFTLARFIPLSWRDRVYWFVDRNRIKWFGTVEHCALIPQGYHDRIIR